MWDRRIRPNVNSADDAFSSDPLQNKNHPMQSIMTPFDSEHPPPYEPSKEQSRPLALRVESAPEMHLVQPVIPPQRPSTAPLRRRNKLDKIDELDESNPLGMPLHHGGPYEAIGGIVSQSRPYMPLGAPLNLSPGQILPVGFHPYQQPTRQLDLMPNSRHNINGPPSMRPPDGTTSRFQQDTSSLRPALRPHQAPVSRHDVPPALRPHQVPLSRQAVPRQLNPAQIIQEFNPYAYDTQTLQDTSDAYDGIETDESHLQPPPQSIPFREADIDPLPRFQSEPSSHKAPSIRSSIASRNGPEPLHRPKRLVMPAPLQQSNPAALQPPPSQFQVPIHGLAQSRSESPYKRASMPPSPRIDALPNERKLLRKRNSLITPVHKQPTLPIATVQVPPNIDYTSPAQPPAQKKTKPRRLLSKKRHDL